MFEKDFDSWNKEKKRVDKVDFGYDVFYRAREVWWCAIGLNVGVETDGKHQNFERPILVVRKFNRDMFWGVPLTSNEKTGEFFQKIVHDGGASWAVLSQIKTFSTRRLLRKIGRISENELKMVHKKLRSLL
jgi:mRNA interferase MazF